MGNFVLKGLCFHWLWLDGCFRSESMYLAWQLSLPINSSSIVVVIGPPIPEGWVKYNGLVSLLCIVVTLCLVLYFVLADAKDVWAYVSNERKNVIIYIRCYRSIYTII